MITPRMNLIGYDIASAKECQWGSRPVLCTYVDVDRQGGNKLQTAMQSAFWLGWPYGPFIRDAPLPGFLNPGERELWVSWQKRGGVIKLSLWRHCRSRDRFDETPGRLGRIMKSARTLQTYSEGGPVPAMLPFARLRCSLCILSCKTETAHKRSPSPSPSFNSIASPPTQKTHCSLQLSPRITSRMHPTIYNTLCWTWSPSC